MARWGKMTARGCYTLTKELKRKLRDVANGTQLAESKHVRNALTLYVPYYLPPEPKKNGDEDEGWVLTIYEPYCLPLGQDNT